jgi:hypothetical protein
MWAIHEHFVGKTSSKPAALNILEGDEKTKSVLSFFSAASISSEVK